MTKILNLSTCHIIRTSILISNQASSWTFNPQECMRTFLMTATKNRSCFNLHEMLNRMQNSTINTEINFILKRWNWILTSTFVALFFSYFNTKELCSSEENLDLLQWLALMDFLKPQFILRHSRVQYLQKRMAGFGLKSNFHTFPMISLGHVNPSRFCRFSKRITGFFYSGWAGVDRKSKRQQKRIKALFEMKNRLSWRLSECKGVGKGSRCRFKCLMDNESVG